MLKLSSSNLKQEVTIINCNLCHSVKLVQYFENIVPTYRFSVYFVRTFVEVYYLLDKYK